MASLHLFLLFFFVSFTAAYHVFRTFFHTLADELDRLDWIEGHSLVALLPVHVCLALSSFRLSLHPLAPSAVVLSIRVSGSNRLLLWLLLPPFRRPYFSEEKEENGGWRKRKKEKGDSGGRTSTVTTGTRSLSQFLNSVESLLAPAVAAMIVVLLPLPPRLLLLLCCLNVILHLE